METAARSARELAEAYFRSWNAGDGEALSALLAPDVTFRGPGGSADGRRECVAGLLGMRESVVEEVVVDRVLVDGAEAFTWFEMRTRLPGVEPFPVVNRMRTGPRGIESIRVVLDPRPLLG